jgi:oxygen-dependent protoporphyrinogen oxidase
MSESVDVAIVGGGIAGLTVAWQLQRQRPDLNIAVLEASDRPGGRIRTEIIDHDAGQFVIELGPDAMLSTKPSARELCIELGLQDELIPVASVERPTAFWHDGQPVDLPEGLSLLASRNPEALRVSPLLSPAGCERALQEPSIPARQGDGDESLGSFVRRRFGQEYLEAIAEPLLAGIHNADPDELSLQATFPQFPRMERTYGSVTEGAQRAPVSTGGSPFFSLRRGIQQLPDTLADRLGPIVRLHSQVAGVERIGQCQYRLTLASGEQIVAPVIVMATPVWASRVLLPPVAPESQPFLERLKAAASGAIVLAWPEEQVTRPLTGFGLVVPKRENQPFNAVTVMSKKFPGRAPRGWSLMRFFFGGHRSPQTMALDDEALLQAARDFAARVLGIQDKPAFVRIARWTEGSPIYQVGHLETVSELEASLPEGLFVTGAPFRGPGIPDVVRSSTSLADQIAASIVPAAA